MTSFGEKKHGDTNQIDELGTGAKAIGLFKQAVEGMDSRTAEHLHAHGAHIMDIKRLARNV